jgi:serine/threonine protein kinase
VRYKRIRQLDCHNNGQGVIWEARTDPGGERVALKYMKQDPNDPDPATTTARFLREIRCQSLLRHPNIVSVLNSGTNERRGPWYAMDWADESLRDILVKNPGGLSEQEVNRIFTPIVEAMAYAHQEGVLHRDLKPENVLFFDGAPRLADFGLGLRLTSNSLRLTQSHLGLGTLAYMAPEQFSDAHTVGPAADVFSLGKILFELITGIFPNFLPDISKAPGKYRYILHRCLEQDPAKRYVNAGQLAQALSLVSAEETLLSPPEEQAEQALARVLAGDESGLHELAEVLMRNPDDAKLYLQFVPLLPANVVKALGKNTPSEFARILTNFDEFAYSNHPFSFCDTLADFMAVAYDATMDLASRRLLLARLLELGESHNRFYVRDVFVSVVVKAVKAPGYAQVVADILRAGGSERDFVKNALRQQMMPQIVLDALEADAA